MKYCTLTILCMTILWTMTAEAQSKKYLFVEHFSNSRCPICINNRAKIEGDLDKYSGEINTMTIHHKPPYPDCELYLFAKEEVDNRVAVYAASTHSISGSPQLCINSTPGSHSQLTNNIEKELKNDDVLVGLNMQETGGTNKKATLEVTNLSRNTIENLYVYAALVENVAIVNYRSTDYTIHNVFRKFLGGQKGKGDAVGTLGAGDSKTIVLEGQVPNGVDPGDIYILAWVEQRKPEGDSYEITTLNSVSRKTSLITNTNLSIPESELSVYPNPAGNQLYLRNTSDFQPGHYRILSATGQEVRSQTPDFSSPSTSINVADLPSGQYFLILENDDTRVSRKFVKQ